ncbi:MAG: GspH/FimT family pseudopilin [Vicinamibacterales bacterium]
MLKSELAPQSTLAPGFSLSELLVATAVIVVAVAGSAAAVSSGLAEARGAGAGRYLAMLLQQARARAVLEGVAVGLHFAERDGRTIMALVRDGDGDGIRSADIDSGIDPIVTPYEAMDERFRGVEFRIGTDCVSPDGLEVLRRGSDALRIGRTSTLVFTPLGTSSSGSMYLCGASGPQVVVRVLGATGRSRAMAWASGGWQPL